MARWLQLPCKGALRPCVVGTSTRSCHSHTRERWCCAGCEGDEQRRLVGSSSLAKRRVDPAWLIRVHGPAIFTGSCTRTNHEGSTRPFARELEATSRLCSSLKMVWPCTRTNHAGSTPLCKVADRRAAFARLLHIVQSRLAGQTPLQLSLAVQFPPVWDAQTV